MVCNLFYVEEEQKKMYHRPIHRKNLRDWYREHDCTVIEFANHYAGDRIMMLQQFSDLSDEEIVNRGDDSFLRAFCALIAD